ncbi:hypothetical protein DPMN_028005 [Dreissena polymorpha]|uniref:Uncharacterized protein n=2 Tax=Dreissena polymorpha TaxID=45954 RepID=A0A9D4LWE5_DREPO|nr:hypothetical protein DPMN_028005 [Dreissena polymorpha]
MIVGAPVSKQDYDQIKAALKSQFQSQEKALESLTTSDQSEPHSVEFSKTSSFSYSNINGAENKVQHTEEKVSEPEAHHVVSDIKEHLSQSKASPDAKPETSFKATLDIPDKGVHTVISNKKDTQIDDNQDFDAAKQNIDFTPKVVAEYLYKTGEIGEFQNLLNDLVEASEISSEEAEEYEMAVMDELNKIESSENSINTAQFVPQGYDMMAGQPMFPLYPGYQPSPNDVYPLYGFGGKSGPSATEDENAYINYLLKKPVSLDDMINTLLNQWLTRAIETDDPEAEEILNNIVDYVSQDDNPNDEAQVRAILGDIFAEALLENLTPRIAPQDISMGTDSLPVETEETVKSSDQTKQSADSESALTEAVKEVSAENSKKPSEEKATSPTEKEKMKM